MKFINQEMGNRKQIMKWKLCSGMLNAKAIDGVKRTLLVFGLLFFVISVQSIVAQTVSIANDRNAIEGNTTPGRFRVNVAAFAGSGTITVEYVVLAGTATPGSDYDTLTGEVEVTYGAFGGTAYINVNTNLQDVLVEGTEAVNVQLIEGSGYTVGTNNTATVTIADDDFATLTIENASAVEGTSLNFTIASDKVVQYNYTVLVTFADGPTNPAEGGALPFNGSEDYNNSTKTVTFLSGSLSQNFNVETSPDTEVENDEEFTVALNASNTAVIDSDTAVGTIENDDFAQVTVEADRPNTNEDGSGNSGRFRIELSEENETGNTITVSYTLTGTATQGAGQDFTISGNANINDGQSSTNININPNDDIQVEGNETVTMTLTGVNSALYEIGTPASDTVTIVDDDVFTATVAATDNTATEAITITDTGLYTISLDEINNTGAPVTVNYTVTGTAVSGSDYSALSGSVVIANGQQSNTITVTPIDDNIVESAETVIVTLNTGTGYELGSTATRTATVTITDTDTFTASVVSTTATANENPVSNGTFTIDLASVNNTGNPVVVNYNITGTASSGLDYNALSGTLSIPNGQRTGTVTVTPINDTIIEVNETVVLTLEAGAGYTIGSPNNATVTIVSDDQYVASITASDANAAESNGAMATGEFTISLSAPNTTGSAMTINYVVSGTAVNGTDYNSIGSNSVNIPNGAQSAQILITPTNDQIQEETETVIITLGTGSGYILGTAATRTATVEITDNDQATLTISNVTVNEDVASGVLVFNVVLDIAVSGGTTVSYSFVDDTAEGGGVDYSGTPGSLTFTGTANEVETINVSIINDAILENMETFSLQLGLPTNGVQRANGGTAIGTINDDDNCVAAPVLDATVSSIYCVEAIEDDFTANLFDFTNSTAPSGTVLTWSRVSDPLNTDSHLTPTEAQNVNIPASYYGFFYDAANDCASGTIEVQIVRNIIPELESVTGNERCGPGTLLLSAKPSDGASISWYNAIGSETPIAFGENFTTPSLNATTTYYVEAIENGCVTERQAVVARIGFQATTGTAQNGAICNVAANGLTNLDLDGRLIGADPGVWVFVSGPESDVSISSTNVVEFEGLTSGAYIFRFTTTNSTAPCLNPTVDVTINVSDCETDDDNDGLLGGQEVALGTDPNNPDTDGDGIEDGVEVGDDIANPLDEDNDGIIDALDSNTEDADNDGVNDQQDPANTNPCIPNRFNGSCDTDGDGLSDLEEQTNGSDPDDPCDPVATPNCDSPIDLEVLKSVDKIDALVGDTVIFEIVVTNLSDRTVRAIVIGDLLELGFDFVSASSTEYDEVTGNWNIAEIEAGLSSTLAITVTLAEQGPYTNTAVLLESIPSDGNIANDESTVTLNTEVPEGVDLRIEKEARPDRVLIGDEVEFIIRVTNISESDVVTDIVINDIIMLENGFEFVSAESDFNGLYDEATGNWNIPELEKEETATLRIRARVPGIGIFTNTANLVRSTPRDSNPLNNEATVEVEVIQKSSADPGFLFNQFSPNGNNQNEVLRINRTFKNEETGVEVEVNIQYKIKIYDRYGNLVFETEKVNDGDVWDGTYKGKEVPKGTYFYIMNYSINNEPEIIDKGWIQLIR
jgi:gliding motility-associated-like protein/uncharacterized repeat protein (TIGR01451 family)